MPKQPVDVQAHQPWWVSLTAAGLQSSCCTYMRIFPILDHRFNLLPPLHLLVHPCCCGYQRMKWDLLPLQQVVPSGVVTAKPSLETGR